MKVNKKKKEEVLETAVAEQEVNTQEDLDNEEENLDSVKGANLANDRAVDFALRTISNRFNVGEDFTILNFKDAPNNCTITVASKLFDIQVKIKNKEELGYYPAS